MAKRLTPLAVKTMKPGKVRREVPDASVPGLRLIIHPTGKRVWALRVRRLSGQSAKVTLGPVDVTNREVEGTPVVGQLLSLPAARQLAASLLRDRAMGRDIAADVVAAKRRARGERMAAAAGAFGQAAVDYCGYMRKSSQRTWVRSARVLGVDEQLQLIRGGLADRWSARPVTGITSADVYDTVNETRNRGVPGLVRRSEGPTEGMARTMHDTLSAMFTWLRRHRRVESNPVSNVHPPDPARERDRVLSDDELVKLWRATDEVGGHFGAIYKLLVLTGCRLNEIAQMKWAELSDDLTTLQLPPNRVKNKMPHDVPLSRMAREVIAAVPRVVGSDFVFVGRAGATPVSGFSKAKVRIDALMGPDVPPWVTHDIRRSTASGLQRLGVPLVVTEKILNHQSGSLAGIVKVYQRHEYAAEKRAALERWSTHIESLVSGESASITPIRRRGR
jgi:integrase